MPLGHVALGDRDEAGQARFGGEQVVERRSRAGRRRIDRRGGSRSRRAAASCRRGSRNAFRRSRRWRDRRGRRHARRSRSPGIVIGLRLRQLAQRRGDGQQRGGVVAAVDRRHVLRQQRHQVLRVVPVQEMAFEVLEPIDRGQRRFEPLDERVGVDEAEVVRRHRRQQAHRDVGRRGAMRDARFRIELHVVGRQPAVVAADERLEVLPRRARHGLQVLAVVVGDLRPRRRRGLAELIRDQRRDRPQQR